MLESYNAIISLAVNVPQGKDNFGGDKHFPEVFTNRGDIIRRESQPRKILTRLSHPTYEDPTDHFRHNISQPWENLLKTNAMPITG